MPPLRLPPCTNSLGRIYTLREEESGTCSGTLAVQFHICFNEHILCVNIPAGLFSSFYKHGKFLALVSSHFPYKLSVLIAQVTHEEVII